MTLASFVNGMLGILTIVAQIGFIGLLLVWFFGRREKVAEFLSIHGTILAFLITLVATLGSLTYSDILGYEPCKLCWFQRIFMYPQVLILGMAVWGKHKGSRALLDTAFVLSIVGALVALYHYLMQLGLVPEGSCDAVGYSVSCAKVFVLNFGYITIPLMAFSAFIFISLILSVQKRHVHNAK